MLDEVKNVLKVKCPYGIDPRGQGFFWPESDQKRSEVLQVRRGQPAVFEATYQCRPGSREGSIFLASDINNYYRTIIKGHEFSPVELSMGIHSPNAKAFIQSGHMCIQAWDTAFSTTSTAAHTVCATGLLVPCQSYHRGEDPSVVGQCEFHFDVLLLNIFRKRIDWGGLVEAFKEQYQLFKPQEVAIEKKASGIDLIAAMESTGIPLIPMPANQSKGARAVNSVTLKTAGSVQGWFRQHRVLVPVYAKWLDAWQKEMKDFSGNDDASSDQVDATVHLITRAIQLGSSMISLPLDWIPERTGAPGYLAEDNFRPQDPASEDPRALILSMLGDLPNLTVDPYDGTCSRCVHDGVHFCRIQGRRMLPVDSCDYYADTLPIEFAAMSKDVRR